MQFLKTGSGAALVAAVLFTAAAGNSVAAPINGTGNVTPDVIFGSGNSNGAFTGVTSNDIELAIRGKLRYDLSSLPQNTFNYDGVDTYYFDPSASVAPSNRSIFNFEYSINTDVSGNSGLNLGDLTYELVVDGDPTAGIVGAIISDPINTLYADHSIGDNLTGNGGGTEAADPVEYASLIANNNVAQQSWNLGFFFANPQQDGIYTFSLSAFDGATQLASTSINVIVGSVPLPASLPLMLSGIVLFGLGRLRRKVA